MIPVSSKMRNNHINTKKLIIVINVTLGVWSSVYLLISFQRDIFTISKNTISPRVKIIHNLINNIHTKTGIIDQIVDIPIKCLENHTRVRKIGSSSIIYISETLIPLLESLLINRDIKKYDSIVLTSASRVYS